MALFSDTSLPKTLPSPLAKKPATPSFGQAPQAISDRSVQAQTNNLYAASAGAGRSAMQGMDRAGISRGKGQQLRADMAQAGADVQAGTAAAQTEMGAFAANQKAKSDYENTMRGEQLSNAGLLENLRSANVRERMAKQGWQQDLLEAMRRGQFGLDSISLDTTPLIDALMRQRT